MGCGGSKYDGASEKYRKIFADRDNDAWANLGLAAGVASELESNIDQGLAPEVAKSRKPKHTTGKKENHVMVKRGSGEEGAGDEAVEIPETELVIGDILVFSAGAVLPVDCLLIHNETSAVRANEKEVFGAESTVIKLVDQKPMLYAGSTITQGKGTALVVNVGKGTYLATHPPTPEEPEGPPPPKMALIKEHSDEDSDDEDDEPTDPLFFLGASTTIGMACLLTFIFGFLTQFGQLSGPIVWIVTFVGGFISFLVPFFYYLCTSKALNCCDKFLDGFFGGIPFLFIGMGTFYVYVCLGTAIEGVGGSTIENKILMYINVPVYMLFWLPLFVFMMHLQRGDAKEKEAEKAKEREKLHKKPKRKPKRWATSMIIFRRSIIGFVCSCCMSAYGVLPFFALAWLCVGLYRGYLVHVAIPICVLLGFAIICGILGAIKKTRFIVLAPVLLLYKFFTLPLLGWSPRAGEMLPKYDNSLTTDRKIAHTNKKIEEANKAAAKGDMEKANKLFADAERDKKTLRQEGSHVVDVEDVEEV